jgi:alanine racemase
MAGDLAPARVNARVDLGAIEHNCRALDERIGPDSALCAVVKANGYGHGAVAAARAALAGGARWLAVAAASEAVELRAAGIDAPLIVLGALTTDELRLALAAGADVVAWTEALVAAARRAVAEGAGPESEAAKRGAAAARALAGGVVNDAVEATGGAGGTARLHLKLDVGMGRLGTRDAEELLRIGALVAAAPELTLVGAMTHFPSADEDLAATREQLAAFTAFGERLRAAHPGVILHAANSAAAIALPQSRLDLVRCGIAVYGLDPWGGDPAEHGLRPALELRTWVAAVKRLEAGQTVGYGATFIAREPTWIATLPIGYGDGLRRAFSNNGDVLVGGRRRPIAGRVSMDNVCVDLGPEPPDVAVGDEAIVIGADGAERITAEEQAARVDTINYEITTALSARVAWSYHGGVAGAPDASGAAGSRAAGRASDAAGASEPSGASGAAGIAEAAR